MKVRAFRVADEPSVIALWRACGLTRPWNDPHRDIHRKLSEQPELFLVATTNDAEGDEIIGSVMAGFDGHRGWVYYLAVDARHRKLSIGRALMRTVEDLLTARGCPKINLLVRSSNAEVVEFYRKLGYIADDTVSLGRRLIHDTEPDDGARRSASTGRAGRRPP